MDNVDKSDNVFDFKNVEKNKDANHIYFGLIDARDSSLIPLQLVLFVFALVETVQAIIYILNEDGEANVHIYSHLGSYMLAYASALFVISFRPARARGLLVIVSVAAVGFISTPIIDVLRGNIGTSTEIAHVSKLIGPLIVWIIAKRVIYFSRNK